MYTLVNAVIRSLTYIIVRRMSKKLSVTLLIAVLIAITLGTVVANAATQEETDCGASLLSRRVYYTENTSNSTQADTRNEATISVTSSVTGTWTARGYVGILNSDGTALGYQTLWSVTVNVTGPGIYTGTRLAGTFGVDKPFSASAYAKTPFSYYGYGSTVNGQNLKSWYQIYPPGGTAITDPNATVATPYTKIAANNCQRRDLGNATALQYVTPATSCILTDVQIASVAKYAGFTGDGLKIITALAIASSNGRVNYQSASLADASKEYGLFAVNSKSGFDLVTLTQNPAYGAASAYTYSTNGTSFTRWAKYSDGTYSAALARANAAVNDAVATNITSCAASTTPTDINGNDIAGRSDACSQWYNPIKLAVCLWQPSTDALNAWSTDLDTITSKPPISFVYSARAFWTDIETASACYASNTCGGTPITLSDSTGIASVQPFVVFADLESDYPILGVIRSVVIYGMWGTFLYWTSRRVAASFGSRESSAVTTEIS